MQYHKDFLLLLLCISNVSLSVLQLIQAKESFKNYCKRMISGIFG